MHILTGVTIVLH